MSGMSNREVPPGLAAQIVSDPVDVVTGAVFDVNRELLLSGPLAFDFRRHYSTALVASHLSLGAGHTHSYDHTLRFDADGIRYIGPLGPPTGFPPLVMDGAVAVKDGHVLRRRSRTSYCLETAARPALEFAVHDIGRPAGVTSVKLGQAVITFHRNRIGNLVGITDSQGRRIRVVSDDDGRLAALLLLGDQRVDHRRLLELGYDDAGNLVELVDAYGHRASFVYDRDHRLVRKTDRDGYSFHFEYDAHGRCVHATGEDGLDEVWLRYESEGLTVVRRGDGGEWTYVHPGGVLEKVIDPYGGMRTLIHDASGRLIAEGDPNGNVKTFVYSAEGALLGTRTPLGDLVPETAADTDPRVHRVPACPLEYEHGCFLALGDVQMPWPDSPALAALPSPLRTAVTTLPPESRFPRDRDIRDEVDTLVGIEDAFGRRRRYVYTRSGAIRQMVDLDGAVYGFEHASWSQRIAEVDPVGQRTTFRYTFSGRLAEVADAGGTVSRYAYDLKDRIESVHRHGVVKERYERDAADNLIAKLDGEGNVLLRISVAPGNLIATRTLASGDIHRFTYDDRGRIVRMASRETEVAFAYDSMGHRIVDERDQRGIRHRYRWRHQLAESAVLRRFVVKYSRRGDRLDIEDPGAGRHTMRALGAGLIERVLSNGTSETAQYDPGGRCLLKATRRVRNSGPTWIRSYRYSGEGDLRGVTDPVRGNASYEYDAAHRLTVAIRGSDRAVFEYAVGNNLVRQPGLTGVSLMPGNRVAQANGSRFVYDHRDNVVERQGDRPCRYRHDSRDLLVGCTIADQGEWTARYDPLGRRIDKTWRGRRTEFLWDTDRLAGEIAPDGRFRLYVYEDAFAVVPFLFIDYESVDADPRSGRRGFIFGDQLGTPLLVEDDQGVTVWSATVDPYGAMHVDPSSAVELALRFPGHYWDTELGLHYNRFRYYTPELGRYLQSDPLGITGGYNLYAYPASPLTHVDVRGLNNDVCDIPPRSPAAEDKPDEEPNGQPQPPTPEELDERFGPATEPWLLRPQNGEGEFPLDAQIVRPGEPVELRPYTNPDGTPGRYIYIVTENGNMIIAPERGTSTMPDGSPRRTTHTDLAQNGPARISGEINPTNDPNMWIMNDDSGRYSQRPAQPGEPANPRGLTDTRTPDQLRNANDHLDSANLGGTSVTNEADVYGDQHYPAMKSTQQR
jgi:RHS repeat-associated protein